MLFRSDGNIVPGGVSGKDWLVGPRYPYKLRDRTHHSSYAAWIYGEITGQSMAYVQAHGTWAPVWTTDVQFSGAQCAFSINSPDQCVGSILEDTAIQSRANYGFTLWDVDTDTAIPVTAAIDAVQNQVVLTASSTLSGNIEAGYAARGTVNPDGTVATPQWSATTGSIKMVGRDAPAHIPAHVMPTLDHHLCAHKKTYSV